MFTSDIVHSQHACDVFRVGAFVETRVAAQVAGPQELITPPCADTNEGRCTSPDLCQGSGCQIVHATAFPDRKRLLGMRDFIICDTEFGGDKLAFIEDGSNDERFICGCQVGKRGGMGEDTHGVGSDGRQKARYGVCGSEVGDSGCIETEIASERCADEVTVVVAGAQADGLDYGCAIGGARLSEQDA